MKFGFLFRKLIIEGNIYLQVVGKIKGKEIDDKMVEIIEGPYKNYKITSIDNIDTSDLVYKDITKEEYEEDKFYQTAFFTIEDKSLVYVDDPFQNGKIAATFYEKFHDFDLIPEYNLEESLQEASESLKTALRGQDDVIDRILLKIYNNQMFLQSDLNKTHILNNKSNILLIGPYGTGKTTIKESLKENLDIPTIEYKLTGNLTNDIVEIIKKLLVVSNNNIFLAMRGIVIYDGINALSSSYEDTDFETVNIYLSELKNIINEKIINLATKDGAIRTFDASFLTHICIIDMDYTKEKSDDNIHYSKVNNLDLAELGLTTDMIIDCFNDEIIYMHEMTKKLALEILKDPDLSPLYALQEVYQNAGKNITFSDDFYSELIKKGLFFKEGFTGILRVIKYLSTSSKMMKKNIVFTSKDIDNLKIGTSFYDEDDYDEDYDEYEEKKESNPLVDTNLKVDLIKRTINDLTVFDTVNLIKQNIKGQDEAIFSLVNAFYNHIFNKYKGFSNHELKQLKENVLFIGSTGVGKTAIVENLARIFNIVYKREIATRYSKAGYIGESVDNMLLDLVDVAKGNIKRAEQGILYIDEIDKIRKSNNPNNLDISMAVQNDLLTIIEGDQRTLTNKNHQTIEFDSSGLFVIGTGAFDGLEEIVKKRIKKEKSTGLGFQNIKNDQKEIDYNITNADLYEYGYDKQFIARIPHKIKLHDLSTEVLLNIVKDSKDGYINLCKKSYAISGIKLNISEGFCQRLAERVKEKNEGARGIKTIFSTFKDEIDKNIQLGDIEEVIIPEESIDDVKKMIYVKKNN